MKLSALIYVSFFCATASSSWSQKELTVTPLHVTNTSKIGIPNFAFSETQCDDAGNLYFDLPKRTYNADALVRITRDGKDGSPIVFPKVSNETADRTYYVRPSDGQLFVLQEQGTAARLLKLSSFGQEEDRVRLTVPTRFEPSSFAVQQSGEINVTGSVAADVNSSPVQVNPFQIWFSRDGVAVHQQTWQMKRSQEDVKQEYVALGPNQTFVSVVANKVYVTTLDGHQLASYEANSPGKYAVVSAIQIKGNVLAIRFEHSPNLEVDFRNLVNEGAPVTQTWVLIDLTDGTALGRYAMPRNYSGIGLCYAADRTFIYRGWLDNSAALVTTAP
jgi:hypothetical protein